MDRIYSGATSQLVLQLYVLNDNFKIDPPGNAMIAWGIAIPRIWVR